MRKTLIALFVMAQTGAALAQGGGTGGPGSGGAAGAAPGSPAGVGATGGGAPGSGTAPTGHRQPRPSDIPGGAAEDRAQKLQEQKNVEGDRTTKSICSNCGGR